MLPKGYIHIYTGNGKGKTSAALGLAFRASGSGLRSIIIQFMKGLPTGELEAASKTGGLVTIERFGSRRFCRPDDGSFEEHRAFAREGYERAREVITGALFDIVILDEIITSATFNLLADGDILALCDALCDRTELVMTGRGASDALIERADLVTEMREIKHYYRAGVAPRRGIED